MNTPPDNQALAATGAVETNAATGGSNSQSNAQSNAHPDDGAAPGPSRPFTEIVETVLSRRAVLRGLAAAAGGWSVLEAAVPPAQAASALNNTSAELGFTELPHVLMTPDNLAAHPEQRLASQGHAAPDNHVARVLLKWGDPVFSGASFDPSRPETLTAAAQEKAAGYNNDFVAYLPLPAPGSSDSRHGLLFVNNEYNNLELMFPGVSADNKKRLEQTTEQQARVEMAAHGATIIEIKAQERDGTLAWETDPASRYNRRLTATTEFRLVGPVAGSPRVRTAADPKGDTVLGTINNCSGGVTPWGTVLSGEENFQQYFHFSDKQAVTREFSNHERCGVGGDTQYAWWRFDERFDVSKHPHEPNRFGWIVEIDPYEPGATPVKRTALGRFRHEGGAVSLSHDGRVVVYLGDDQRFEYLYKYVSDGAYDPTNRAANFKLLDEGTLYAARFGDDGRVRWLPLVYAGKRKEGDKSPPGPLGAAYGFTSQADVLIETRRAASLLGATPLDRPEDVEENPRTGHVYVMLTNNTERGEAGVDRANPRPANAHGHIIELRVPRVNGKSDHAALEHDWDVFLRAGDIRDPKAGAWYQGAAPAGWLSCPDNCAFDGEGRLWIATDGAEKAAKVLDGLYVCDTVGPATAWTRLFFRAPTGAEVCGPCFTPDGTTLFVAVQHPGETSDKENPSTFEKPSTRWPNPAESNLPPQPAVVAITRKGGGRVG